MIDEEQIRLFNELMSTQPGEQIEGLASRYPDVFEKPRVNEIPDPLNMKGRIADSERKRKEQEEAEFQAKYGQKTIWIWLARSLFLTTLRLPSRQLAPSAQAQALVLRE
jgi:hypothetical protein